ncbi:MAG: CcdB family protein [Betaproteobacteria bacterium]
MARFDVYPNPDAAERAAVPFWLDVQNTFIEVDTRVVVPLHAAHRFHPLVRKLNPVLLVEGRNVVMNTSSVGAVPVTELHRPVANLKAQQIHIQEALDTLLGGY